MNLLKTDNVDNINIYKKENGLFILNQKDILNYSSMKSIINLCAIINKEELLKDNKVKCSFEFCDKKYAFEFDINEKSLNDDSIKKSDMLHKIIFNKYTQTSKCFISDKKLIKELSISY